VAYARPNRITEMMTTPTKMRISHNVSPSTSMLNMPSAAPTVAEVEWVVAVLEMPVSTTVRKLCVLVIVVAVSPVTPEVVDVSASVLVVVVVGGIVEGVVLVGMGVGRSAVVVTGESSGVTVVGFDCGRLSRV